MKQFLCSFLLVFHLSGLCQTFNVPTKSDSALWTWEAQQKNFTASEMKEYIHGKASLFSNGPALGVNQVTSVSGKGYSSAQTHTSSCAFDFESGSITGWNSSSGYNPLFNMNGCCLISGADYTFTSGSGLDPYTGQPVVCPGGNFSLRLGSTTTGGKADRLERQFTVTANDSLFSYKYAVVLNGAITSHNYSQQPFFHSVLIDSLGSPLQCTDLVINPSDQTIAFLTSSLSANGAMVVYMPWRNKVLNLKPYIGQKVTLQFTVYDCSPSGHFAYVYLDSDCFNTFTPPSDTICGSAPQLFCGPDGFHSYAWSGPSTNSLLKCIPVSVAGTYTCQTFIDVGCQGPAYVYTLSNLPGPTVSVTSTINPCSLNQVFSGTVSGSSITSQQWNFGDGATSATNLAIHSYSAPGQFTASFDAVSVNGCAAKQTVTFTLYPKPLASFNSDTICSGETLLLMNQSTISTGSIVSNVWNFGSATSSVTNAVFTLTVSGIYTPTLIVTSSQGCSDTTTQSILVAPRPQPAFMADTVCFGVATSFTNLSSIANGTISSTHWNFGNSVQSQSPQPSPVLFTNPGNFSVTLNVISDFGCADSVSQFITVKPSPTISAAGGTICEGQNFILAPSGAMSYSISGGTATVSPLQTTSYTIIGTNSFGCTDTLGAVTVSVFQNPVISLNSGSICAGNSFVIVPNGAFTYSINGGSFTVSPSSTSIYTVTGKDSFGCVNQQPVAATVTVYQLPTVTINSGSICAGDTFTLIPQGAHTYTFVNGGPLVSSVFTATYSVVGTSSAGCLGSGAAVSTVVVHPNPLVTVSASSASICANDSVTISAQGAQFYSWNGIVQGSTIHPKLSKDSLFTVIGKNSFGCSDTAFVFVSVHPAPVPVLSLSRDTICEGEEATLSGSGALNYVWDYGSFTSSVTFTPSQSKTYTVTCIGEFGCMTNATVSVFLSACLGIGSENTHPKVFLYPNPAHDEITLALPNSSELKKLWVYNQIGQITAIMIPGQTTFKVSEWSSGIYNFVMLIDESWHIIRVLKE